MITGGVRMASQTGLGRDRMLAALRFWGGRRGADNAE